MNNDTPADAITQADVNAYWEMEGFCGNPPSVGAPDFKACVGMAAFAKHRTTSLAAQDGLVDALRYARSQIVGLAVSGTDRIDELCRKLQQMDPSPIWPIPFPDPPERTWQPIVKRIDEALASIEVKS